MALADILKKVFGSKSDRDMKQVKPMLDKVLAAYPGIDALSDYELRARSAALRAKIFSRRAAECARSSSLERASMAG